MRQAVCTALSLLAGCYGTPAVPDPPPSPSAVPVEARPRPTPPPSGDFERVLERLSSGDPSAPWWAPERDKLLELLPGMCATVPSCRAALGKVAAANLPVDDRLAIGSSFLRGARGAVAASDVLLEPLLRDADGAVRDRAFRLAVALGTGQRGDADAAGRRIGLWPADAPRLLVAELPTCPAVRADVKGPDAAGRIDLVVAADCPPPPPDPPDGKLAPKAERGVITLSLPAQRPLSIHIDGAEAPTLRLAPPGTPTPTSPPKGGR